MKQVNHSLLTGWGVTMIGGPVLAAHLAVLTRPDTITPQARE